VILRNALAVLALGLIVGIAAACGKSDQAAPGGSATQITIKPTDIVRGNPNAPITMVEYASMTCPHCARWQEEVMPKLDAAYIKTGKVRYIFREFPLDPVARMASALARCQKGEGFHSFIDLLFKNQRQWVDPNGDGNITQEEAIQGLVQMARVAGLSQPQAEACMADPKNLQIVDDNFNDAQTTYAISSTPTFFVDSTRHVGEWKWEELDKVIKEQLAKQ
jgi:protein-disulfide isomerase